MFHGIEELTKDWEGFVYWKGIHVEHYSYNDKTEEAEAAKTLADKCRHIESLGLPVSGSKVVWCWSWFSNLRPDEPYLQLLAKLPSMYENTEGAIVFTGPAGECLQADAVMWDGSQRVLLTRSKPYEPWDASDEFHYHGMRRKGFDILKGDQASHLGTCYSSGQALIKVFQSRGVPPDLLAP